MPESWLVRMPKLADTLVEGTLGQWLKRVGDPVRQGEPLASIETDKVTTDMPSPVSGTLFEQLVAEGATVAVETPIARIGELVDEGATVAVETPVARIGASDPGATTLAAAGLPVPAASVSPAQAKSAPNPRPRAAGVLPPRPTPVAARLLAEHGLRPDQVTTRSGRLTRDDVLRYLEAGRGQPAPNLIPLTPMRRAIAEHMSRARQTIPHGQTVMDADLSRLVAWRDLHKAAFQKAEGANLSFTVCFVHALARASASKGPVDLGVAVALEGGLIVPVLRHVETLSLGATARGIADLASRAREQHLMPDEIGGAQMTVTNVGSFGNLSAAPIVPVGQIAILGPGVVERRPMPSTEGGLRQGWRCRLCLVFDRRALDDLAADRLLRRVVEQLRAIPDTPPA